jgi:DNA-directed RNA polymerase II subunit RPB2
MEEDSNLGPEEEEEIVQEDAWTVISAFFDEKGLVRQVSTKWS